jgi:heme/copper-type cytochrome/quinol oxidase subunit 3
MANIFSTSAGDHRFPGAVVHPASPSRQALRFFGLAFLACSCACVIAWTLATVLGRSAPTRFQFPFAFLATTALLAAGSCVMSRARRAIRRERQVEFRRWLLTALAVGAFFMGAQSYALWTILPAERSAYEASAGVAPFVLMLAALHGLHFLVATLFLSYVTTQALAHRYDHEYHWGVTVCAWFWHALGIVWCAILAVYSIVLA